MQKFSFFENQRKKETEKKMLWMFVSFSFFVFDDEKIVKN